MKICFTSVPQHMTCLTSYFQSFSNKLLPYIISEQEEF